MLGTRNRWITGTAALVAVAVLGGSLGLGTRQARAGNDFLEGAIGAGIIMNGVAGMIGAANPAPTYNNFGNNFNGGGWGGGGWGGGGGYQVSWGGGGWGGGYTPYYSQPQPYYSQPQPYYSQPQPQPYYNVMYNSGYSGYYPQPQPMYYPGNGYYTAYP